MIFHRGKTYFNKNGVNGETKGGKGLELKNTKYLSVEFRSDKGERVGR